MLSGRRHPQFAGIPMENQRTLHRTPDIPEKLLLPLTTLSVQRLKNYVIFD
jgi:hypothetical protein